MAKPKIIMTTKTTNNESDSVLMDYLTSPPEIIPIIETKYISGLTKKPPTLIINMED